MLELWTRNETQIKSNNIQISRQIRVFVNPFCIYNEAGNSIGFPFTHVIPIQNVIDPQRTGNKFGEKL